MRCTLEVISDLDLLVLLKQDFVLTESLQSLNFCIFTSLRYLSSLRPNSMMMIMMHMKRNNQEASEETHLIKTTKEANMLGQDEKWPLDDVFFPYLSGIKEYPGGWCMIYVPLGECVCCSVQCLVEK